MDSDNCQRLVFTFSNSGVVQTYTRNPGLVAELFPNQDNFAPLFSSLRIVHRRALGNELITDYPSEAPEWINYLKSDLKMPADALLRYLTVGGVTFGVRWQNYNLRFVGIVITQAEQLECGWPFWRICDTDGNFLELVQVWYQRVSCLSSPVICDVRWQPGRGEAVGLHGLENAKNGREITAAWRGRVLLQKINLRGRPENSVALTRTQFTERAPQACAKLLETLGEMPTDVEIAAELQISRATLYRYMDRYGLTLNQIRDTAIRLLIEPTPSDISF